MSYHKSSPQINSDNYYEAPLSNKLIGLAFDTFNSVGAGFAERIYQNIYTELLLKHKIDFEKEKYSKLIVFNKNVGGHRVDFLIEDKIVVELKCRNELYPKDISQVINYLKVNDKRLGLIFCFTKKGVLIKRIMN